MHTHFAAGAAANTAPIASRRKRQRQRVPLSTQRVVVIRNERARARASPARPQSRPGQRSISGPRSLPFVVLALVSWPFSGACCWVGRSENDHFMLTLTDESGKALIRSPNFWPLGRFALELYNRLREDHLRAPPLLLLTGMPTL